MSPHRLVRVAESAARYCDELVVHDPRRPTKPRSVLSAHGPLRELQSRLYRHILLPRLQPSPHSHGGITERSILSNLNPHVASVFGFTTDISNFYPSIHNARVYRLFVGRFACSPDVARICTHLCTQDRHLALGLITSPFIADQIVDDLDQRIAYLCTSQGLVYTRFVDDITISSPFDLESSGFPALVDRIVDTCGFALNREKEDFGKIEGGISITKLRVRNGKPDVAREYVAELERQISDATSLAADGPFQGPFFTKDQIRGRVSFVCRIRPGRRFQLWRRFQAVPWDAAWEVGLNRGLVVCRRQVSRR